MYDVRTSREGCLWMASQITSARAVVGLSSPSHRGALGGAPSRSKGPSASEHRPYGLPQDLQIEQQRVVLDVE